MKIRLRNLEGDAIIIALSVAYLGSLPIERRIEIRKDISEKLLLKENIETSEYWSNKQSEAIHCKYFKKVI